MTQFVPTGVSGSLQADACASDPRYGVGVEWIVCRDGVRRPRYKATFCSLTIGEIAPSFDRKVVIADLQELIDAGGVGAMADLPNAGGEPE